MAAWECKYAFQYLMEKILEAFPDYAEIEPETTYIVTIDFLNSTAEQIYAKVQGSLLGLTTIYPWHEM